MTEASEARVVISLPKTRSAAIGNVAMNLHTGEMKKKNEKKVVRSSAVTNCFFFPWTQAGETSLATLHIAQRGYMDGTSVYFRIMSLFSGSGSRRRIKQAKKQSKSASAVAASWNEVADPKVPGRWRGQGVVKRGWVKGCKARKQQQQQQHKRQGMDGHGMVFAHYLASPRLGSTLLIRVSDRIIRPEAWLILVDAPTRQA
jgi:hypothetical protein